MLSIMNSLVNLRDIPQAQWKSGYVMNNVLNHQDIPQAQCESGDVEWAKDADDEMVYWRESDLDTL